MMKYGLCVAKVPRSGSGSKGKPKRKTDAIFLFVASPFFPGILFSRKPPKTPGKQRSVFEKEG